MMELTLMLLREHRSVVDSVVETLAWTVLFLPHEKTAPHFCERKGVIGIPLLGFLKNEKFKKKKSRLFATGTQPRYFKNLHT